MEQKDRLFELIESLNKSEKGYFKKTNAFHVKGGQNAYMRLFNIFEKLENYDEQKIADQLSLKDAKQLPYLKFYLYERILDSLDQYYQSSKVIINKLICKADILFNKGLKLQAYKLIDRAREYAKAHEKFGHHLVLIRIEEEYLFQEENRKIASAYLINLQQELQLVQSKYQNLLEYLNLKNEVASAIIPYGTVRSDNDRERIQLFFARPLLNDVQQPSSTIALFHFHVMRSNLYFSLKDFNNAYKCINNACDLIHSRTEIFEEYVIERIQTIYHSGLVAISLGKQDETQNQIDYLKTLKVNFEAQRYEISLRIIHLEILKHTSLKMYDNALAISEAFNKQPFGELTQISELIELQIISSISHLHFIAGHYSEALEWNNKVLNGSITFDNIDIICAGRILDLFIHTELENFRLLTPKINSAQKFLLSKNRLFKHEKLILIFLGKYVNTNSKLRVNNLKILYKALHNGDKKNAIFSPLEAEYVNLWMENKLNNIMVPVSSGEVFNRSIHPGMPAKL
ncbi:MAG: hypothetical protein H0W62_11245 [Chitinophagales bacterium]|nr:hypothetical protein [Chitinophagales bacterium]